ncbi:hypothetical protein M422DRAFT_71560, partial [Sphaerobolus stellatus SS14]
MVFPGAPPYALNDSRPRQGHPFVSFVGELHQDRQAVQPPPQRTAPLAPRLRTIPLPETEDNMEEEELFHRVSYVFNWGYAPLTVPQSLPSVEDSGGMDCTTLDPFTGRFEGDEEDAYIGNAVYPAAPGTNHIPLPFDEEIPWVSRKKVAAKLKLNHTPLPFDEEFPPFSKENFYSSQTYNFEVYPAALKTIPLPFDEEIPWFSKENTYSSQAYKAVYPTALRTVPLPFEEDIPWFSGENAGWAEIYQKIAKHVRFSTP